MVVLGVLAGAIIGMLFDGISGAIAGAFVGFIVAMVLRPRASPTGTAPVAPRVAADRADGAVVARLAAIEARLARLEALAGEPQATSPRQETALPEANAAIEATGWPRAATASPSDPDATSVSATVPFTEATAVVPDQAPLASGTVPESAAAPAASAAAWLPAAPPPHPLWAWLTGGNALARIGVLVLFFGIAFLLKDIVQFARIPITAKLAGVALAGGALIALGAWLARARPGYGLSLQGAGAGILYLTAFAAFRLYEVLPPLPAFVLLVAVAALTVTLALRADSQPLAGLAIAGGFLAPLLVATGGGTPARLFGYFAVLNAVIFALAWVRSWRALNVLGFVFTFVLAIFWGGRFYRPEHFATVEPFLVGFFLFYVAIAVLYARKGPLSARAPVDALLVFGVPLVAFALQSRLVDDVDNAVMWSALAMAALYAILAAALIRRSEPGLALLARAFVALAIVLASIAIAFGAEARTTAAWWALEAAAVYWIGCVQRQWLTRAFALALQVGAAVAFVAGGFDSGPRPFFNTAFLGTSLLALAAFTTAFVADRHHPKISARERSLTALLLVWGLAWWIGGAARELWESLSGDAAPNALLGFVTATSAVALLLGCWLRWGRLIWVGAALLPTMLVVGFLDWERMRTTLAAAGWLIWPLAWVVHWYALLAIEILRAGTAPAAPAGGGGAAATSATGLRRAHTVSAIALVAWAVWEASEWTGRVMPRGTVWMACAAAWPAIVYLTVVARSERWTGWPLARHRYAYANSAATTIAAFLGMWFVLANLTSPGDVEPLPYLPLANPLDLTLVAALGVLFVWARRILGIDDRPLYGWWGLAVFLLINAVVFRTVHQWQDVAWSIPRLLGSRTLQAALTLTWTTTALPLMVFATRWAVRPMWMVGAALLAVVVVKLFVIDLAALSGLTRVVAFIGVGVLLLLIGYLTPLPPAEKPRG